MSRLTVDYGIDLGTTNSSIARMGPGGPESIANNDRQFVTPSVVAVNKKGQVKIGSSALVQEQPKRYFKRLMGSTTTMTMADESVWTPQQLSAEILKDLKASAKRRFNDDVESVVITVPAMFNQPQCAATQEAATLAGLRTAALLQEPIAAATAFLSSDSKDGFYLVYDLGGGTFDCSLIHLLQGEMNVVEHGGDNYLGGSDFDRALLEWSIGQIRRKGGNTDSVSDERSRSRYVLSREVERTRVLLSDRDEAILDLGDLDIGLDEISITRSQLEAIIQPFVDRTIKVVQKRLEMRNLRAEDVRSILLVGGPTQTPYIRKRLANMCIPVNFDKDPMTVVAEGAARHSATIVDRPAKGSTGSRSANADIVSLELFYEPVTPETVASVAFKVINPAGFKGEAMILSSEWESGWIPLVKGAFALEVPVRAGANVTYGLAVRDVFGSQLACEPSEFSIRSGIRAAQPVLPYDYGVVLADGATSVLLRAATPLPAPAVTHRFESSKGVRAGSPESLKIYFVEGSSRWARDNKKIGELTISGTDLERNLKVGEPIEVRMSSDENRGVQAMVFLPQKNQDFSVVYHAEEIEPVIEDVADALLETQVAISKIEKEVEEVHQDGLLQASRRLEQLEAELERVQTIESGEVHRIHSQLQEVRQLICPLIEEYGPRALYARTNKWIADARSWAVKFSDSIDVGRLDDLAEESERQFQANDEKGLENVQRRAISIYWKHYGKTAECWEGQVRLLKKREMSAQDDYAFHEYVHRAELLIKEGDLDGARLNVFRAWDLLPNEQKSEDRFFDAGLKDPVIRHNQG